MHTLNMLGFETEAAETLNPIPYVQGRGWDPRVTTSVMTRTRASMLTSTINAHALPCLA